MFGEEEPKLLVEMELELQSKPELELELGSAEPERKVEHEPERDCVSRNGGRNRSGSRSGSWSACNDVGFHRFSSTQMKTRNLESLNTCAFTYSAARAKKT
jgi:hypothetical protein